MNDKVEQITGVIGDPKSWAMAEQGGELVQVELRPGVRARMFKSESVAKGLWKEPEPTLDNAMALPPAKNKMRRPGANK